MSWLANFFAGAAETSDHPKKGSLKTHYYRNDQRKVLEIVQQLARDLPNLRMIHMNESQSELTFELKDKLFTHDIVLTLFRITPMQYAIDIYSSSRSRVPDFGKNEKIIQLIYNYLDSKLTVVNS